MQIYVVLWLQSTSRPNTPPAARRVSNVSASSDQDRDIRQGKRVDESVRKAKDNLDRGAEKVKARTAAVLDRKGTLEKFAKEKLGPGKTS